MQGFAALKNVIASAAQKLGIPAVLLTAQADKESSLNPRAVSAPGSSGQRGYGLLQLEPATFQALMPGGDPMNPLHNLLAGGSYLKQLRAKFANSVELALAAYNWGPGNVTRLVRKYGASYEAIKAQLPLAVRYYVWRVLNLASQWAPYWR